MDGVFFTFFCLYIFFLIQTKFFLSSFLFLETLFLYTKRVIKKNKLKTKIKKF